MFCIHGDRSSSWFVKLLSNGIFQIVISYGFGTFKPQFQKLHFGFPSKISPLKGEKGLQAYKAPNEERNSYYSGGKKFPYERFNIYNIIPNLTLDTMNLCELL